MDPLSPIFVLWVFLKLECRYRSQTAEMTVYQFAFEGTSALVSDVDCISNRLSSLLRPEFRARVDRELQRTRLALENARPVLECKRGRIKWALEYPGTVKAHMRLLAQCHDTLLEISSELAQLDEQQPWRPQPEKYFHDLPARMFVALASEVVRDTALNSGAGDHMRLFEPKAPQQGICPLLIFCGLFSTQFQKSDACPFLH
jgi:hypothetical protein